MIIIRPNYDKRNESFREEVQGVMERFKVGYDSRPWKSCIIIFCLEPLVF